MAYDPAGFVNLTIAALFATLLGLTLWWLVDPDTPRKQRLRYVRMVRRALRPLLAEPPGDSRLGRFEGAAGGALVRLARELRPTRGEDLACLKAALALIGAGRELACRNPLPRRPAGGEAQGGPLARVRPAIGDCLRALRRPAAASGELLRAAAALGAAMDAFAGDNPPTLSVPEATSDAR
jgi:hypothetical protein